MTIKLKNKKTNLITKIEIYDDIDSMPYQNYMHFQRNLILDGAVGSDFKEIANEFQSTKSILNRKDLDRELIESKINNLFQRFIYAVSNFSYKSLSFACLLKNQKEFDKDSLQKSIDYLCNLGIANSDIESVTEHVKKKFLPSDEDEVLQTLKMYL